MQELHNFIHSNAKRVVEWLILAECFPEATVRTFRDVADVQEFVFS